MIDKDAIKKNITIDQVEYLLEYFGGEPTLMSPGVLVSRTIDHNPAHEGSRKLYYYDNEDGGLFRSYTGDALGAFDIFDLVIRIFQIQGDIILDLPAAIKVVCSLLHISMIEDGEMSFEDMMSAPDIKLFKKYDKMKEINIEDKKLEFKTFSKEVLENLPQPRILMWEKEGITKEVIKQSNIRFDPKNCAIIIPYYDDENNLIGIRERLIAEDAIEEYGKYRPAYIGGQLYNHPLGLSVFGLDAAKNNIKRIKKVIVFESEKSVLLYRSYFGEDSNIAVAVCGSALSRQQVQTIMKYVPEEIIVAFDKDYETIGDKVFNKQIKLLEKIYKEYSPIVNITFIWDKTGEKLKQHSSPIDEGKEKFIEMFLERIQL